MKVVSLFPHVGSGNHGCEAIVRSTKLLFSDNDMQMYLFSNHPEEDSKYIHDDEIHVCKDISEISRFSLRYFKAQFLKRFLSQKNSFNRLTYSPLLKRCGPKQIMLSIGGDLYCYDTPEYIYEVNQYVREQQCFTVLWGCSVEPNYIDSRMSEDIKGYDLICARESITYNALREINPNTVLMSDPAFVLPKEKTQLPSENYIGINVSPMIIEREGIKGITLENYVTLIQYILDNTSCDVALIPHVVWETNDDRAALKRLKEKFIDNDRVISVEDHNCCQLKYIISNCRVFVGARTHATIAAYSTCVPTLVVGYSVKARGIAKDIFGTHENYVIPVQSLKTKDDLLNAIKWILDNESSIRTHLHSFMPEYKNRTQVGVEAVNSLR